jgi:hypothetical protein
LLDVEQVEGERGIGLNSGRTGVTKPSGASKGYHTGRKEARPKLVSLPLLVQFYSALRLERLHPLVVKIPKNARGSASSPVVVRPVIAGALVFPAEEKLDPADAGATATFQVTPLVQGPLAPARLEVLHQGRLVGTMRLRLRTRTQQLTFLLAILAVLITGLCVFALNHPEYKSSSGDPHPIEQTLLRYAPQIPWLTQPIADGLQVAYNNIFRLTQEHYLAFWAGLGLALVTGLSWLGHQRRRQSVLNTLEWQAASVAADPLDEPANDNPPVEVRPLD